MGTWPSSLLVCATLAGLPAPVAVRAPVGAVAADHPATPPGSDRLDEPAVAVDPADPQRVITAANDLDAGLVGVYTSLDGARTFWRASFLPQPDSALGESDPGLAFDRLGRAYASYVSFRRTGPSTFDFSRGGLVVARSDDGGLSWPSAVLAVANHGDSSGCFFADFPSIAVAPDRNRPGADIVYGAWQNPGTTGPDCSRLSERGARIGFARSGDGGRTWERPAFPTALPGILPYLPVVHAAPDGSVYVADNEVRAADRGSASLGQDTLQVMVASSTDGGGTWTTTVAHEGRLPVDGDVPAADVDLASLNGALYRLPASTNVVQDPVTGALVSVAGLADSWGRWVVDVASSTDRQHWVPAAVPARLPGEMQEFPRLAVAPDGALSLLWICELPGSVLEVRLAISHDDGRSWGDPVTLSSRPGVSHLSARPGLAPLAPRPGSRPVSPPFIGDDLGNTFGPDGAAHPVWTDVRSPPTRIYTAHLGTAAIRGRSRHLRTRRSASPPATSGLSLCAGGLLPGPQANSGSAAVSSGQMCGASSAEGRGRGRAVLPGRTVSSASS